MIKANSNDKKVIRAIAKAHGVAGCAQPLHAVYVGKQGKFLDLTLVKQLTDELRANGFVTENNPDHKLVDVLMVWKAA